MQGNVKRKWEDKHDWVKQEAVGCWEPILQGSGKDSMDTLFHLESGENNEEIC